MKEAQLTDILLELSENAGVAGDEEGVVGLAARYFRQYTDRVETDRFGNLIAFKRGEKNGTGEQVSLAVLTHIDEIGAMVTKIEAEGFLRFTSVGGIDPRTLLGQAVVVHGRTPLTGVIGALAPHLLSEKERKKELKMEHLFIDLGLTREQALERLNVGDFISLEQKPLKLPTGCITGKSLDNRAGVAAAIFCAAELAGMKHDADIYFVTTLQEEVGLRGAVTAAYGLAPDLAVAVDVTHGELPGLSSGDVFKLGQGVTIALGPNIHPALSGLLKELAREQRIPYQPEPIPASSSTDAWAAQVSREGIPAALLSIPLRYMHSVVEMLHPDDLTGCGRLLSHFARSVDRRFVEGLACF
ncbi:MAG TPA: M20/M25/M40 family metallo-hydrolase [Bacillota bacterium]|nr:M20/M25/M40 family metallo-hydrolase [Bacillota bacterium]